MTSLKSLADSLDAQARAQGKTRRALKQEAGIATQTLVNIMNGKEDYRMSSFLAVADRLGLEVVLLPRQLAVPLAAQESGVRTAMQRLLAQHVPGGADKVDDPSGER